MFKLGCDVNAAAAKRGSVTRWHLMGPVRWTYDDDPADKESIGEPQVDLRQLVPVEGFSLRWKPFRSLDVNGKIDLATIYGRLADAAVYAYAEVDLPEVRTLILGLCSNDGYKCWFNGEVVSRYDTGRGYAVDDDRISVQAVAGRNRILVKVLQLGNNWALGVRLRDKNDQPIKVTQP